MNQTKTIRYRPEVDLHQFDQKQVAVYARVSREGELKHHSIEAQKQFLKHEVEKHVGWIFAGYYVDEGITGTKINRPEFNRLMHDARAGKIDIILTKTISRLGRNFVAVQKVIQELKSLGVIVIFDNENISTADPDASLYLHFLGIQAEAEAKQTSEYQRWSIRNRFAEGIPTYARPYGYIMKDHKLYIIPEEAKVVKRIFNMYLSGMGKEKIAKQLNQEKIPSFTGAKWQAITIHGILNNEKYTGNMLLQKWYVSDFITKVCKHNHGEVAQYWIEDTHEPIITNEIYERAQTEIARRSKLYGGHNKGVKKDVRLFNQLIRCSHCHKRLNYKRYTGNGTIRDMWVCENHIKFGPCTCPIKSIREDILTDTTREVLMTLNFIKDKDVLTNELLRLHIREIIICDNQTLKYCLHTGEIIIRQWQYDSRSKSWTPEMRQKARARAKQKGAKHANK